MTRRTVARTAELSGIGLHIGAPCRLRIGPGSAGTGIVFVQGGEAVPALLRNVVATERRTALQVGSVRVETAEHLLAAVYALGVDDLRLMLEGPELPIMDGSFEPFVGLIDAAGRTELHGSARLAVIDEAFDLIEGEAHYRVEPADAYELEVALDYPAPVIGKQTAGFVVTESAFRDGVARARTFGFLAEVETLRARGLLGGAAPGCAIVLSEDAVLNTTLRWPDEFARHKLGDLIGDLALLGSRLALRVRATRPSHRGNVACARAIAAAARFLEA